MGWAATVRALKRARLGWRDGLPCGVSGRDFRVQAKVGEMSTRGRGGSGVLLRDEAKLASI